MRITLEDNQCQGRGFFSSVNLTLLAISWCQRNNLEVGIGNSILRLYSHPISRLILRKRPFSSFFGNAYIVSHPHKSGKLFIGDIWNLLVKEINFEGIEGQDMIESLHRLNQDLLRHMPSNVHNYINSISPEWPQSYDLAIHYRGCDYLKNTPRDHVPNLQPEAFIEKIFPNLVDKEKIFVSTDDSSFTKILRSRGFKIFTFDDVTRGNPGKGTHHKNR